MAVLLPVTAWGQSPSLADLTIEDLMQIRVTSVSRRDQRAADVAAAVYIITQDDIRRSGLTSLPALLRLVPGAQVAQVNSNKWAVSLRGFNSLYSNKLLVLVDGRSIYNRLYSGVLWDAEDPMLDDIDRIEVIRGPAAALWGANAVNGVINIVTKSAADTRGGLLRVESSANGYQGAARYGGAIGGSRYRAFAQWTERGMTELAPEVSAGDRSRSLTLGFRVDRAAGRNQYLVEGALSAGRSNALWTSLGSPTATGAILNEPSDLVGAHTLMRWTHTRPSGASLQVQSSLDMSQRTEPIGDYDRRAFDFDAQYRTRLGARHDVVWGVGYRAEHEGFFGKLGFALLPASETATVVTAFVHDELAVVKDRLTVTLGAQVQHDSRAGGGLQPTIRAMWMPTSRQRVWAAVSRALRTPSMTDRHLRLNYPAAEAGGPLPVAITLFGNPQAESENLIGSELGYRVEFGAASIDVTGFVADYDRLLRTQPLEPRVVLQPVPHIAADVMYQNSMEVTTRGLELLGRWAPHPSWRMEGSYSHLQFTSRLPEGFVANDLTATLGTAPRSQWQLRSIHSPGSHAKIEFAVYRVGELKAYAVPAYTRVDATGEWRFDANWSLAVTGQNLVDRAHPEFSSAGALLTATQMPRSVRARLRWSF